MKSHDQSLLEMSLPTKENIISQVDFNHSTNLRGKRPYLLFLLDNDWILALSVTSQEKASYPHKFELIVRCDCLDSELYENSFVNLNTKILIPIRKILPLVKKYGIKTNNDHNCLTPEQMKELWMSFEKYWSGGKRKLITIVLNN